MPTCKRSFLGLMCLVSVAAGGEAAAAARPNVIVVLSDDQGYGDFSCHGNPVLKTPYLDKLHAQSIRFTDFHVAPMCTPTRGQLLTGLDALRSGATSVCAGRSFIRRGIPTMAEIFAANGYRTAHFGKWHLGDSYPHLPHQRGFQESVYHLGWGITSMADTWLNDCFDGRFFHNGKLQSYPGYCTDVWFDLAMRWISQRRTDQEPFFLYLPTNAPHGPHWVAQKYKQPYVGRGPEGFFGMIANLDENMGRLEALLAETGLRENTILVYFHDNGGTAGVKLFNAGMRGKKATYYEGGHRAACFLRWPKGNLRPAGDIDELTQVQDLLPTLIELCGLENTLGAKFDGTSLAGLLRGRAESLPERTLVVQYGQRPQRGEACVMWKKWRLVKDAQLFDLRTDPGQAKDVAGAHPEVVKRLRDHYAAWWDAVAPRLDDFSPISIGAEQQNPVTLSAADWANVYCDNMQDLRAGKEANAPWHVLVEQAGQYEFALRRWPKDADAPIAGSVPEFQAVDGGLPAGVALPIARARLKIGDVLDESKPVAPHDKAVVFRVTLAAGAKLPVQSWFYDAAGKELCGAYFADVQRQTGRLPNALRVHEKVISGGQPQGEAAFQELRDRGVKTIISVDGAKPDVALARQFGLRYVHLPHGYDGIPESRVRELAKAVRDLPGPIYIHCHHGKHRSPAAAAVACVGAGLIEPQEAPAVLQAAGTSQDYRGLYQAAQAARRLDDALLEALEVEFRETASLPPLAAAMVGVEEAYDRLRRIAAAGWQPPVDEPALAPAHEALLLREHFTELLRFESLKREPPRFEQLMREAEQAALGLEASARRGAAGPLLDAALERVTQNCTACHREFRDVPLAEKARRRP